MHVIQIVRCCDLNGDFDLRATLGRRDRFANSHALNWIVLTNGLLNRDAAIHRLIRDTTLWTVDELAVGVAFTLARREFNRRHHRRFTALAFGKHNQFVGWQHSSIDSSACRRLSRLFEINTRSRRTIFQQLNRTRHHTQRKVRIGVLTRDIVGEHSGGGACQHHRARIVPTIVGGGARRCHPVGKFFNQLIGCFDTRRFVVGRGDQCEQSARRCVLIGMFRTT
mmetsp:Transcript_6367/g.11038  ORF Transcript_6367/g.11038 Transcript_6367/m.11038 type:complete len:224 (-) Transcript_6367:89-760(-)